MAPFPQNKSSEGGVVSKLNQHFFHDESTWVPSSQKPLVLLHASGSDESVHARFSLLKFRALEPTTLLPGHGRRQQKEADTRIHKLGRRVCSIGIKGGRRRKANTDKKLMGWAEPPRGPTWACTRGSPARAPWGLQGRVSACRRLWRLDSELSRRRSLLFVCTSGNLV